MLHYRAPHSISITPRKKALDRDCDRVQPGFDYDDFTEAGCVVIRIDADAYADLVQLL